MIKWFLWWFIEARQCKHVPEDYWVFCELGMSKALYCKKCGKMLDRI